MVRPLMKNWIRRAATIKYRKDFGNVCYYCGCDLNEFSSHVDHIIPVSTGGTDDVENLVLACCFCNRAKWDLDASEYLVWLSHVRSNNFNCIAEKYEGSECFDAQARDILNGLHIR